MISVKELLSTLLKRVLKNKIGVKPYKGTSSYLYFEKAQHLMFAFRRQLSYEPIIQNKTKQYIKESDLVFDIGGNIGQYALLFSELVGKTGKVISLEPDFKNYNFLKFNIGINNIVNVFCLKKGVGNKIGTSEFYRDTETGGRRGSFNSKYVGETYKGYKETVDVTTIDSLVDEYGYPDFVKIDVEGFEREVLGGINKDMNDTVFLIEVREETKDEVFDFFSKKNIPVSSLIII